MCIEVCVALGQSLQPTPLLPPQPHEKYEVETLIAHLFHSITLAPIYNPLMFTLLPSPLQWIKHMFWQLLYHACMHVH